MENTEKRRLDQNLQCILQGDHVNVYTVRNKSFEQKLSTVLQK